MSQSETPNIIWVNNWRFLNGKPLLRVMQILNPPTLDRPDMKVAFEIADIYGWRWPADAFDVVAAIFVQFADPAMRYFFTVFNRGFNEAINKDAVAKQLSAALTSERSFSYFREGNRERHDFSKLDWDGLISSGYLIAGNPDSVAKQIKNQMSQIGADHFKGMFHIGNLAHENVVNSLNLFKKEIMPRLQ